MFDITQYAPVKARWDRFLWEPLAYDQLDDAKAELRWLESQAARIRARQTDILAWLSEKKVADLEAARSLEEWTAASLDVAPTTARDLTVAARTRQRNRDLTRRFEAGEVTFDRAVAVANLIKVGGDDTEVAASYDQDLSGVRRRTADLKQITPVDETEIMRRRHVTLTPTLDHTAWNIAGMLPGHEGHLVALALQQRADQFPDLPGGGREGLAERQADALTALAMDWLDATEGTEADRPMGGGAEITVFVDAADLARSEGRRGTTISGGPRIGPATLDRLLCGGRVGLVSLDADGRPIAMTDHTHAIPPAVRAAVLNRDKGCDRRLPEQVSPPGPSHPPAQPWRRSRRGQPGDALLVPPPHCSPPSRPLLPGQHATATQKAQSQTPGARPRRLTELATWPGYFRGRRRPSGCSPRTCPWGSSSTPRRGAPTRRGRC